MGAVAACFEHPPPASSATTLEQLPKAGLKRLDVAPPAAWRWADLGAWISSVASSWLAARTAFRSSNVKRRPAEAANADPEWCKQGRNSDAHSLDIGAGKGFREVRKPCGSELLEPPKLPATLVESRQHRTSSRNRATSSGRGRGATPCWPMPIDRPTLTVRSNWWSSQFPSTP